MNIKPKEAVSIINSLTGGVVPKIGVQHLTVGRNAEVEAVVNALQDVANGHSLMKFWIGDYGSGKSFMMHLLNIVAMKQKFVVTNADFTPDNRLYANDRKSVALYTSIIDNLAIQTKPEGGALPILLEKWIGKCLQDVATNSNIPFAEITDPKHRNTVRQTVTKSLNELTDTGAFDFTAIILLYLDAYLNADDQTCRNALRWLKGEYHTKTEARQDLGVRDIIDDQNYYDMLKNLCRFFVSMGYSGFMISLDEAVNLYKISTSAMREKNYEKILSIYNDCFQGKITNLFINIAGTRDFLENERRGLFSYHALKSRLEVNKYETAATRDFSQPVIRLLPLDHNEIFVLLRNLKEIFDFRYETKLEVSDDDMQAFMEVMFNKPGASEFLTPREVIRDFLNILSMIRQHPELDKQKLFGEIDIHDERPNGHSFDTIEEL